MSQPMISVWRLHPRGVVIKPADPTMGGQAPASAKKYCGPYMHANASGFYLHSPIDLDLSFDPGRPIPWQWNIHGNGYTDDEVAITQEMPIRHLHFRREMLKRRTKLFLSGENNEPLHTAQIWTGCIFKTPPQWSLWVRSPINREYGVPFRIEEGILEADWLSYDLWLNLKFIRFGEEAHIRRDGPPLAQLVPIPRPAYEPWRLRESLISPENPEAQVIFDEWIDYNWEKFHAREGGVKDSATYTRRRRKQRNGS